MIENEVVPVGNVSSTVFHDYMMISHQLTAVPYQDTRFVCLLESDKGRQIA